MSAGAIGGASSLGNAASEILGTNGSDGFGDISSEDFMKILLSELSNQDPFEPQDSGALLEQLSNIRNIEGQIGLQEKLEALVLQNQVSAAGSFIGRLVQGLDERNDQVQGQVTSVRVEDGSVFLELDTGNSLPLDRVTEVSAAAAT